MAQGLSLLLPQLPADDIRTLLIFFEEEAVKRQVHHLRQIRADEFSPHRQRFMQWRSAASGIAAARRNISEASFGENTDAYVSRLRLVKPSHSSPQFDSSDYDGMQTRPKVTGQENKTAAALPAALKGGQLAAPVSP